MFQCTCKNTTKHFNFLICQFKNSPLWHVHFFRVRRIWIYFSGQYQREQCNDSRNYVETHLLMVQAWIFLRFVLGLNIGSNTMLNFMNHIYTRQNESYLKNKYAVELSNQCKLNNIFMTEISHKSDKYCSDYYNINLHWLISNTMVVQ